MKFKNSIENRYFFFLLGIGLASLVFWLGCGLFNTKGEPREAVVALSMLQSGDWISPVNNGVDIAYKPPFFHWCIAICSLMQGYVSEFTSRLPSAIAALAMVLVGYKSMLYNKVKPEEAILASMITLTAFEVHRSAMACRVDMMLSALVVISIYMLCRWYLSRRMWVAMAAVLAMSAAALTKGPVGILLPCCVVGLFMLVRGENFFKAFLKCLLFALAACVLPFVWYYMAYQERGEAFLYLVYEENVLRFTGKMAYSSHEAPAIYNVVTLVTGFLPYTLLLLMSLFCVRCSKVKSRFDGKVTDLCRRMWNRVRRMSDQELLSLTAIAFMFVFFCIPKSKRSVYLLPIYPFLSYYIARLVLYFAAARRGLVVVYGKILLVSTVAVPMLMLVAWTGILPENVISGKHASEVASYLSSFSSVSFLMVMLMIGVAIAGAVYFCRKNDENGNPFALCKSLVFLVLVFYMSLDALVLPCVYKVKSDYYVANEIKSIVPEGKIWDYRKDFRPGQRDRMHQFSVNFYIGDRIVPLDLNKPKKGYIIMGDDDIDAFAASYKCYKLKKIKRFNHKSCDDKRILTLYSFVYCKR